MSTRINVGCVAVGFVLVPVLPAAAGATATFMGGNLTGTANSELLSPSGQSFDSDGATFTTLTSTLASGGTDSGIVTATGSVFGSASLNVSSIAARDAGRGFGRGAGVGRVVFEAEAEARIEDLAAGAIASQSIAVGPGGIPSNFLIINVDQDTAFTFSVDILNANDVSSSSVSFSAGSEGMLLAGEDYLLTWSIGAFVSESTVSQVDDVSLRATILLPSAGVVGPFAAAGWFAARRRRRR